MTLRNMWPENTGHSPVCGFPWVQGGRFLLVWSDGARQANKGPTSTARRQLGRVQGCLLRLNQGPAGRWHRAVGGIHPCGPPSRSGEGLQWLCAPWSQWTPPEARVFGVGYPGAVLADVLPAESEGIRATYRFWDPPSSRGTLERGPVPCVRDWGLFHQSRSELPSSPTRSAGLGSHQPLFWSDQKLQPQGK